MTMLKIWRQHQENKCKSSNKARCTKGTNEPTQTIYNSNIAPKYNELPRIQKEGKAG